jgi:gamma-glutamylcyclotransferase (GGCT)/AIG2-like uncharacterized protein YtfP
MLIAVYGSLRKGLYNHVLIEKSTYVGKFDTLPEYNLYDLGSYPALTKDGNTSIVVEVYRVNEKTLVDVDRLEGYRKDNLGSCHYVREKIDTPFGEAYIYVFPHSVSGYVKVTSGDWEDHINEKHLK